MEYATFGHDGCESGFLDGEYGCPKSSWTIPRLYRSWKESRFRWMLFEVNFDDTARAATSAERESGGMPLLQ